MYAGMSARTACSLMLHRPATTSGPVLKEHRKRVWWTTFIMDTMISSEMGLRSSFAFSKAEHSTPTDEHLPMATGCDFWDSMLMSAHIKLCNIRSIILETLSQVHATDFAGYEQLIAEPLRKLETWKLELPVEISFDFTVGVPQEMLNRPSVRSLASCYLRFHQVQCCRTVTYESFLTHTLGIYHAHPPSILQAFQHGPR